MKELVRERGSEELWQKAEKLVQQRSNEVDQMSLADVRKLAHELQVYQIELELQNEELRRSYIEAEKARLVLCGSSIKLRSDMLF